MTWHNHICVFQTTTELRHKYSEYLDIHGFAKSQLFANAFDAIWAAAKTINASLDKLHPNETIDQFSYDNERMARLLFDSLLKLKFQGASVCQGHNFVLHKYVACTMLLCRTCFMIQSSIMLSLYTVTFKHIQLTYKKTSHK